MLSQTHTVRCQSEFEIGKTHPKRGCRKLAHTFQNETDFGRQWRTIQLSGNKNKVNVPLLNTKREWEQEKGIQTKWRDMYAEVHCRHPAITVVRRLVDRQQININGGNLFDRRERKQRQMSKKKKSQKKWVRRRTTDTQTNGAIEYWKFNGVKINAKYK